MDFKENIGKDATPLNMLFRAIPTKDGTGYMLHAYLDQSGRTASPEKPKGYADVTPEPYLTPEMKGPFAVDGPGVFISKKMMDDLMKVANYAMDVETGIIVGSMTTTMTNSLSTYNKQWGPDIYNVSGKGYVRSAQTHDFQKLNERVDRSISLPREAAKYLRAQSKEAEAAVEVAAPAKTSEPKAPIVDDKAPAAAEPAKEEAPKQVENDDIAF